MDNLFCLGLQELESRLLVPGDILTLPGKVSLPCDAVLIDGSCVVDEGMLTGRHLLWSFLFPAQHLGQVLAKQVNIYSPALYQAHAKMVRDWGGRHAQPICADGDSLYTNRKHLTI